MCNKSCYSPSQAEMFHLMCAAFCLNPGFNPCFNTYDAMMLDLSEVKLARVESSKPPVRPSLALSIIHPFNGTHWFPFISVQWIHAWTFIVETLELVITVNNQPASLSVRWGLFYWWQCFALFTAGTLKTLTVSPMKDSNSSMSFNERNTQQCSCSWLICLLKLPL